MHWLPSRATGTISFLILGFCHGHDGRGFLCRQGQRFGAGDFRSMRQNVGCAILLSVITTVILTAVSCLGMHWMLNVMHTPSDIIGLSYEYIIIICGGMFTMVLYNLASGILRAIGKQQNTAVFPDPFGYAEYFPRPAVRHHVPHECVAGAALGNGHFPGNFGEWHASCILRRMYRCSGFRGMI
jgi:hypothetical protein